MAQNNSSHKVVIKTNITGQQNLRVRSGSAQYMIPSLLKSKVLKINRYIEKLRNFSLYKGDGESKNFHLSPLMASFEVITRACQLELQFFILRESGEFFYKTKKTMKNCLPQHDRASLHHYKIWMPLSPDPSGPHAGKVYKIFLRKWEKIITVSLHQLQGCNGMTWRPDNFSFVYKKC